MSINVETIATQLREGGELRNTVEPEAQMLQETWRDRGSHLIPGFFVYDLMGTLAQSDLQEVDPTEAEKNEKMLATLGTMWINFGKDTRDVIHKRLAEINPMHLRQNSGEIYSPLRVLELKRKALSFFAVLTPQKPKK